jgi:YidC/Oxa1 family membrane protein insertase
MKQPYPGNDREKNAPLTDKNIEKPESGKNEPTFREPAVLKDQNISVESAVDPVATTGDTLWVETDNLVAGISNVGARIISLKMKKYKTNENRPVELMHENNPGGAGVIINADNYDNRLFTTQTEDKTIVLKSDDSVTIAFESRGTEGKTLVKKFSFAGSGHKIGLKIISDQLRSNLLTVSWLAGIRESENTKVSMYHADEKKCHYSNGETVEHIQMGKEGKETPSGSFRWIGVSSKYFFISLVADTVNNADLRISGTNISHETGKDGKKNNNKDIKYSMSYQYTPQSNEASFWFYAGPSEFTDLRAFKLKFEKILFPVFGFGRIFFYSEKWFPPIAEFVLWLLLRLFGFTKDYGIAILLLTLLSRIFTYPLTQSSMKSMGRMKDLQPKINALRQKHKSNPKKLNEETMALYKAEGINPLNPGCLPMFLQMPIFIALFVVLQKAIELRGAGTVIVPWIHDLSKPEMIFSLDSIIPGGLPMYGSNFALLPIIMAVLTFFQNKMTIKDPNQKMMIYFMPIFMLVLFNSFPAGLVLYWTFSNALGLFQQYYNDKQAMKKTVSQPVVQTKTVRKK